MPEETKVEAKDVSILRFDLVLAEFPAVLTDPKTKLERRFVIREYDGQRRNAYMKEVGDRIEIGPDGKVKGFKRLDGADTSLLAQTLYEVTPKGERLMPEHEICRFPSRVITALADKARELCGLEAEAEEEAGNDSDEVSSTGG